MNNGTTRTKSLNFAIKFEIVLKKIKNVFYVKQWLSKN